MSDSRVHKSWLNAKINLLFYFITLFISFFSRKIFLEYLGAEFIGLAGTIGNLLSFLNMAELGIGTSIGYVLYKPLFEKNQEQISDIISVLGYLYRVVGNIIFGAGVILSCFLPLIFHNTSIPLTVIYTVYFSFFSSTLLGYFLNYRYTLFGADQKNYLVTTYFQTALICKTIIQLALAYYHKNYYLWATIEFTFGILYCFIINWKTNKVYPWLKTDIRRGKSKMKEYNVILIKAKQLFIHRIATLGRYQALPFLIYIYSSLTTVAFYGNYTLIVDKVNAILNNLLNSTGAGVGSMIAEGDDLKIQMIYWELISVRYFLSGILMFGLYYLLEPFIHIWLGAEYIMSREVLIIILINLFIMQVRGTNDQFIHGYGLFSDTWAPLVTLGLTIIIAILGGIHWGLPGVLAGDAISGILIIYTWKPIYLYRKGFKLSVWNYWRGIVKQIATLVSSWIISYYIITLIAFNPYKGYATWLYFSVSSMATFIFIYGILSFIFLKNIRSFAYRIRMRLLRE